jgi:hypothetical protein
LLVTQLIGESLQDFTAAIKQLVHWAIVQLSQNFIQREGKGIRDREVMQQLLMGGDKMLNDAPTQAMKLEPVKVAT